MVSQSERGSPVIHIFKQREFGFDTFYPGVWEGEHERCEVREARCKRAKLATRRFKLSSLVIRSENVSKKSPNSSRHILRNHTAIEFETTDCHVLPVTVCVHLEFHHQQKKIGLNTGRVYRRTNFHQCTRSYRLNLPMSKLNRLYYHSS